MFKKKRKETKFLILFPFFSKMIKILKGKNFSKVCLIKNK